MSFNYNIDPQSSADLYISQGLAVIPLKKGSKEPAITWKEFTNRMPTSEEIQNWNWNGNIGIVTGVISECIVIDADNQDSVEFLEKYSEFSKNLKVVTRRGIHYYFHVLNIPLNFGGQKIYTDRIKIDIKANNGYVVAPPSQIDGFQYHWVGINGDNKLKPKMKKLSFEEFTKILQKIRIELGLEQEQEYVDEKAESEKIKKILDVDLKKLSQIIKRYYREGNRQNIAIYTAGLLGKIGFDLDAALGFITKIANECGDTEIKMRIAGVRHTFQKLESRQPVKGITGLIEVGISEEELKKAFISIEPEEPQKIKVTIPTVTELLQEFCCEHDMKIDYDEFYIKIFVNDREINRETEIRIQSELEKKICKRVPDDVFQKAMESIAYLNKKDRLKEFLLNCKSKWDGTPRIHMFFHDVFCTPLSQYSISVSKNFFVAAVARAFQPGCFQKNIIIIQGPQNIGKSRALMALGKEFHREINVSITTEKDFYMALQGVWIAEIPEMEALRRADRNRIKAIISSTIDRFRPPYHRLVRDFPRRCVFTCTTNDFAIFEDPTGGTRFWPVDALEKANIEYIEKYREQLFGEAVYEYEKSYKYWDIDEHEAQIAQENARRHDEWEQIIYEYIINHNIEKTTVAEIAKSVLNIEIKDLDKAKQMRIADCLSIARFKRKTIREGTKIKKVWVRNLQDIDTSIEPF
ncbi:VapE domain-containing protein [Thermodesulfovibrio yellowstonii]|uniref:DNA primase/polymerase bifunctional N-terminal domain-containing protein n=1 Tax=Thermodesulfovibrio yellowstonii TaxID=28262 RepID=A0A9W6GGA4_9BACT|nr:VapE domain-containing protein [Thermodesulfovibrio islandicus]GLI53351.1 hypothetical protein TISLANDTSLP1_10440 [Thermodesulfovibrio islandicus]